MLRDSNKCRNADRWSLGACKKQTANLSNDC